FRVVEQKPILACAGPAMQPVLRFADDACQVRYRALAGFQDVDPLDGIPEPLLLTEVHPIALVPSFNQDTKEIEEELQVFGCLRKRERIDGEIARFAPYVQVCAAEYTRDRFIAAANIENVGLRTVFLRVLRQENR